MRIRISHETTYTYDAMVRGSLQLLRMTPRSSEMQFVRKWRVSIDADARLDRGEDAFGNITHMAFVDGPFDTLRILVEGEVDTTDTNGFVRGSVERLPDRLFLRETALTLATPALRAFASATIAAEGGNKLAGLHHINEAICETMTFVVGATTEATTAGDAFEKREGVCQDFAHIFVAAARAMGVPARYVSGYYLRSDRDDQEAGHAWAEAHLPGFGWLAFDPSHGVCATERYVRVAVGSDGNEAAPIRGARSGGQTEALAVAIKVEPGRQVADTEIPPGAIVMSQRQQQS